MERQFEELYKNIQENNSVTAFHFLHDLSENIKELHESTVDEYVLNIFNQKSGLLIFINDSVKSGEFNKAIVKAFEILYTFFNNFTTKLAKYTPDILAVCLKVTTTSKASSIEKRRALELLKLVLLKSAKSSTVDTYNVKAVYNKLYSSFDNSVGETEVTASLLNAIGVLIKNHPNVIEEHHNFFKLLMNKLESFLIRASTKNDHDSVIASYFTCLSDLLYHNNYELALLYGCIKKTMTRGGFKRLGHRAALSILTKHAHLFSENLCADAHWWENTLTKWLDIPGQNSKIGYEALDAIHQKLSEIIIQKDYRSVGNICEVFIAKFVESVNDSSLYGYKRRIAIRGLGYFAGASKAYLPQKEVNNLFIDVVHLIRKTYLLNNNSEQFEYLPDYIQTLSNILKHLENLSAYDVNVLEQATVLMIKLYPQLSKMHHNLVIDAISTTLFHLKSFKDEIFNRFLQNVIYQGVIWSCSHVIAANAEMEKETGSMEIITYKNYLTLWCSLLKKQTYESIDTDPDSPGIFVTKIFDELLITLIVLSNKLNLNTKTRDADITFSDPEKNLQAIKINDFDIFVNLVDLYVDILNNVDCSLFKKWAWRFLKENTVKSDKYPLVSGFYKLIATGYKLSNKLNITNLEMGTFFILKVLLKINSYKGDLKISCMQVILNAPIPTVREILPKISTVFISLFAMGRSNIPLANLAIDTLDVWYENIPQEEIEPFLKDILPSFDPFLSSKSISENFDVEPTKKRKTQQVLNRRKVLTFTEPELFNLQKKILVFLGKLGSDLCSSLVNCDKIIEPVTWGQNPQIRVILPYSDVKLDLYLDKFVPRILELALYCSERKLRVSACEVLHSIIMILLGNSKLSETKSKDLNPLLKKISFPLLQLGCDSDHVVEAMFRPLMLQMMHWYSSPIQLYSSHTAILIDTLMDGATFANEHSVRDFSCECIHEFISWTIKQTPASNSLKDSINLKIFIRKVKNFSFHSDPSKRLAAALIFNNIYTELREDISVIKTYWFELLHCFVKNLSMIDYYDEFNCLQQVEQALDHIERVLVERPNLFTKDINRRIPIGFEGSTLNDVALFLLEQTSSLNHNCRTRCMSMFLKLAPKVDGCKGVLKNFLDKNKTYFNINWVTELYEIHVCNQMDLSNEDSILKWMSSFLVALTGNIFVCENKLQPKMYNVYETKFFEILNRILNQSDLIDFKSIENKHYYDTLNALIFEKIIMFLLLLIKIDKNENLDALLERNGWSLFCKYIFDEKNVSEEYNKSELMSFIIQNCKTKQINDFIKATYVSQDLKSLVPSKQRCLIRGLILLNNSRKAAQIDFDTKGIIQEIVNKIFEINDGQLCAVNLLEVSKNYCELLLELALNDNDEYLQLVTLLCDTNLVRDPITKQTCTRGSYIYDNYKKIIVKFLVKKWEIFFDYVVENATMELTCKYIDDIFKLNSNEFDLFDVVNVILIKWNLLKDYFNESYDNRISGLEMVSKMSQLLNEEKRKFLRLETIRSWILEALLYDPDNLTLQQKYTYKMHVISSLSLIITIGHDPQIEDILMNIQEKYFKNVDDKTKLSAIMAMSKAFETAMISKSVTIFTFSGIIYTYLDVGIEEIDISNMVKAYVLNLDIDLQVKTLLNLYEYSKNCIFPASSRCKLVANIMSELLRNVDYLAFENFFVCSIKTIMDNIKEENSSTEIIVNKTVTYILLKILFYRIHVGNFESKTCKITQAFTERITDGKELLKMATYLSLKTLKENQQNYEIDKETFRVYQCNCFNALVSIISNTQTDILFYDKLFNQEINGENVLWRNLIDFEKSYTFEMDFEKLPTKTKTLVGIRSSLQLQRKKTKFSQSVKYIESQTIYNSSLDEDILKYDLSTSILKSQPTNKDKEEMIVDIDSIEINSHECMATLCGVIQHMVNKNIASSNNELPKWMDSIRKELQGPVTSIKLYLAKLVENNQEVFKPFAKYFFSPIIQLIVCEHAGSNINYFVAELILMLISWSENDKPEEKHLTTALLEFMMEKINCNRADMMKYHLELIKSLVECWKSILDLSSLQSKLSALNNTKKADVMIKLHSIFLANGLQSWNSLEVFAKWICKILEKETSIPIYKSCSETIGMALKLLQNRDLKQDELNAFTDLAVKKIKKCENDENKYLYCLEAVSKHYPKIGDQFITKLIYTYKKYIANFKRICLRIFLERIDYLCVLDDFVNVDLEQLLNEYDVDTQVLALEIVLKVFPQIDINTTRKVGLRFTLEKLKSLVFSVCLFANNTNSKCRSIMYDILMIAYHNFHNEEIVKKSKEMLLLGIMDANPENEGKVITFWLNERNLPKNIFDRYNYILKNMYNPSIEKSYLGYFVRFILDDLFNSDNFNDPLFDYHLSDCKFNDYDIKDSWRIRHISLAPMFATTYKSLDSDPSFSNSNVEFLRATQTLKEFDPTFEPEAENSSLYDVPTRSDDGDFKRPYPVSDRLQKRRFHKDLNKIGRSFAFRHVESSIKMAEKRKDMAKEREQKVELYRKYRTGDFPDIQIKLSDVIGPLLLLTKNDTHIARIFYTSLFESIFEKIPENKMENFIETLAQSMNDVFSKSIQYNSNVMGAFLDVALAHRKQIQFQPEILSKVCSYSSLSPTGTLILEEYLILKDDGTNNKKIGKGFSNDPEINCWVKLAELYKVMDEWDMVRAIFRVKMNCNDKIVEAINAESSGLWTSAQNLYREAINNDESLERRDFYYESCYKCFAELSDWEKVTDSIKSTVENAENVWNELWDGDWNQQKLLPWYITAEIRNTLNNEEGRKTFFSNFQSALSDPTRTEYIKENFCEEYAFLLLSENEFDYSMHYLNIYIKNFLGTWSNTSPLLVSSRTKKLMKMRSAITIYEFLQKLNEMQQSNCEEFISKFCTKLLKVHDEASSIVPCETKYIYNNQFIAILKEKIQTPTLNILNDVIFDMEMKLIEISIKLSNLEYAKKLLKKYEEFMKGDANSIQHIIYRLAYTKVVNLRVKSIPEKEKKLMFYMKMLQILENFSGNEIVLTNPKYLLLSSIAVSELTQNISNVLESYDDAKFKSDYVNKVRKLLNIVDGTFDVETFGYEHLKKTLTLCTNERQVKDYELIGEGYLKLSEIAIKNEIYMKEYIVYVLRAMYYGSNVARQIFPCLLNIKDLGVEHRDAFLEESSKLPVWMFISWIPQLLANLDTKHIFALHQLITNIAKTYPQAIMYAYRLSKQKYKFIDDHVGAFGRKLLEELDQLLLNDPIVDKLLCALSSVSVPQTILKYYTKRLIKACQTNNETDFGEVISNLKQLCEEDIQFDDHFSTKGPVFKLVINCAKKLINLGVGTFRARNVEKSLQNITNDIENMGKSKSRHEKKLSYYSPWLEHLCESKLNLDIEIPGQYKGDKKPLTQYHVKICGFSSEVDVFQSLRKPIQLTFIGNDAKEYTFIVKFGEDLRQDQRIEQLFGVVNNIFKEDSICQEKRYNIRTYQVVPLTCTLGIIECVPDTVTIEKFLTDVVSEHEFNKASAKYVQKYLDSKTSNTKDYVKALLIQNVEKTIAIYRGLVSDIPWDVYRKSFWNRSVNTESYIALRNKFITNHSISCIVNWLLGIGDRHQQNTLISLRNGETIDVDFGHAFGTSVQILGIPELVPFRLTPHIVNLMQPFNEHGLISETMIHVLRALRNNSNVLLATMDVFIKEPSLEWLEFMKYSEDMFNGEWCPKEKVAQAQRKLEGANPCIIMAEEIAARTDEKQVIDKYIMYVKGVAERNVRARKGDILSVEDQVVCLIDQATDYNLLGRMYVGWAAWV